MIRAVFAAIAALAVIAALGGLSWAVVSADRAETRANAVRLALWRLDAQATALVLTETAVPLEQWRRTAAKPPIRERTLVEPTLTIVPGQQFQESVQSAKVSAKASPAEAIAEASAEASSGGYDRQAEQPAKSSFDFKKLDYQQRASNSATVQNILYNNNDAANVTAPTLRWSGDDLVIDRPVTHGGTARTRINWDQLHRDLRSSIIDLLPAARLRPVEPGDSDRLASLPVALDAGSVGAPLAPTTWWMLGGAWTAGLGGLLAVLAAMAAAARLAERRAAFVSAVTHELRTPLTALRLHGDLLADARIANDPVRRAAPVNAVRDGAARLAHLIDNVLDYARLERRRPPTPRSVTLDSLLGDLETLLPGIAIPPLPALTVRADPQAVERILANLADNARKYGRPPFALTITSTARRVTLALSDHGPGLAPDARARLFTPFARSAEAAAGDAPGVGLGLALCRRLARAQGGDLTVDDGPAGGVRAVLTLRVAVG